MESFSFNLLVKGVKFYEGYNYIREGVPVLLEWERGNRDPNAVAVFVRTPRGNVMSGRVEYRLAQIIGPYLKSGRVVAQG